MRTFLLKFSLVLFLVLGLTTFALAGNIDTTDKVAKGFNNDIGRINFAASSTASVTVSSSQVTGYAWGENIGWINLHSASTTSWGVDNDVNGNLPGYAWNTNYGWINFDTASSSVTIDSNGYYHGYAWHDTKGWIPFNCQDVETDLAGTTDSYSN